MEGCQDLQVARASEDRVEAGGVALDGSRTYDVSQAGHLVLADQLCKTARRVIRLYQKPRSIRVVSLYTGTIHMSLVGLLICTASMASRAECNNNVMTLCQSS